MKTWTLDRWLALSGALFVFGFVGVSASSRGNPPGVSDSTQTIVDYVSANQTSLSTTALFFWVVLVVLVAFLASITRYLEENGGDRVLLRVAYLSGLVLIAGLLVRAMSLAALGYGGAATSDGPAVRALWQLDRTANLMAPTFPLALLEVSLAISILRSKALPAWLAWVALLGAVLSLIRVGGLHSPDFGMALGPLPLVPFLLFIEGASIAMAMRMGKREAGP
jgi:ABC-type multidrug transport system fused ATPase/permease subunit